MNLYDGIDPPCSPRPGRVEIVMLSTPEVAHYSWLGESSWAAYAEHHAYSLHICRQKLVPDMHINWSKIELVRQRLAATDAQYLLLVDADSFVFRPAETFDLLWQPDREIVFSNDQPFPRPGAFNVGRRHWLRWRLKQWKLPNAGFVMMRVESYARDFFDRWLDHARNDFKHLSDIHPRNQNVLWRALLPVEHGQLAVLDNEVVRLTHPSHIRHLRSLQPFAVHFKNTTIPTSSLRHVVPTLAHDRSQRNSDYVAR